MSTIHIASTPRTQTATIFDPSNSGHIAIGNRTFEHLKPAGRNSQQGVGGRFVLPSEFDSKKFASSFQVEGNTVMAMQRDQPIMGTDYVAQGWKVWRDIKGELYKIPSLERDGPTYILMFRPIEVQEQVNEVYGILSVDNMTAEVRGDTIAGQDPSTMPSMLSTKQLNLVEREVDADAEYEKSQGKSVVKSKLHQNSGKLVRSPQKISK